MPDKKLSEVTEDDIETARQHLEDLLIELRDSQMSVLPWNYFHVGRGLVVKEFDTSPSNIIRLSTAEAIRIAIKAMLEA